VILQWIYRSLRSVLLIFLVLCVLLICFFTLWVPCCDFRIQTMLGSSLPPVICKSAHVLLRLFVESVVQRKLCWVVFFVCFFSLSCVTCSCGMRCQFLWIVHFVLPLQYSLSRIDFNTLNVKIMSSCLYYITTVD
jgi:hypothetical protein